MDKPLPETALLKDGLQQTWNAGDYASVAKGLERSALDFLARCRIARGERLLDVACGTGQLAIPAARQGVRVTGIDIAPRWIERARKQAESEGLSVSLDVGDAEELPYADSSFDLAISLIGAMFAPRPDRVVKELLRVVRPGGHIIMGNWPPKGFVADFFKTVAIYAPPPKMPSPLLWGDEETVRQRFGAAVKNLHFRQTHLHFDYPIAPSQVAEHYLAHFGPTLKASEMLNAAERQALKLDLEGLWAKHNSARDGTTQVDAELLEFEATVV